MSFVTQGDVEINLLVVRAGVELAAQLNTQVRPQAEVRGSECTVGIALWRTNEPMEAHFSSFYQTQDCPLWVPIPSLARDEPRLTRSLRCWTFLLPLWISFSAIGVLSRLRFGGRAKSLARPSLSTKRIGRSLCQTESCQALLYCWPPSSLLFFLFFFFGALIHVLVTYLG